MTKEERKQYKDFFAETFEDEDLERLTLVEVLNIYITKSINKADLRHIYYVVKVRNRKNKVTKISTLRSMAEFLGWKRKKLLEII